MDFLTILQGHQNTTFIILLAMGVMIGYFIPKTKVYALGKNIGAALPKETANVIGDLLDALEQGIRQKTIDGKPLTHEIIANETKKLKEQIGVI